MIVALPTLWERAGRNRAEADSDQISLFGEAAPELEPRIEPLDEFPDRAAREFEGLGFHLREHPLAARFPAAALLVPPTPDAKGAICVAAILATVTVTEDKKGRTMARVRLETLDGHYDGLIFASLFSRCEASLEEGLAVVARGRVEVSGRMLLDEIAPIATARWRARIRVAAGATEEVMAAIETALAALPRGKAGVELLLETGGKSYRLETRHAVAPETLPGMAKTNGIETIEVWPV
jgi:DNA polymerase III alpha subunit